MLLVRQSRTRRGPVLSVHNQSKENRDMAKIGIMGGTFDPIHNGHLLLGRQAHQEYGLDEIWFMPSGDPPHKKDHPITDAVARCDMVRLAIAGEPAFRLSEFEVRRPGNTYTSETLQLLAEKYPHHTFFFIAGADSIYEIEQWNRPELVMARTVFLVAAREYEQAESSLAQQIQYLEHRYHADIRLLHCQEIHISSNELRRMESRGKALCNYMPEAVARYIEAHGLYQEEQNEQ